MACSNESKDRITTSCEVYYDKLKEFFPTLVQDMFSSTDIDDAPMVDARMKQLLEYHVETKRLSRGVVMATAYKHFENDQMTPEKEFRSYIMAWCFELTDIAFEILDDILDESKTRRGSPSWHLIENNNAPMACNDAWTLENFAYALFRKHFRETAYYADLIDLFHDRTVKGLYGKALDALILTGGKSGLNPITLEQYLISTKFKASYLSCYSPIKAAMLMSGIEEREYSGQIMDICEKLGQMFQIQNDYLDVYGDQAGVGNKIPRGKCSWVVLTALQVATEDQRKIILENYGWDDPQKVLVCKELFTTLEIPLIYESKEKERIEEINSMLSCMPKEITREPFFEILKMIQAKKF